jgi:hypothetical protein
MAVTEGTAQRVIPTETGAQLPTTAVTGSKDDPPVETIVPNPLLNFASWVPLWTLASISIEQFNNPASYRVDGSTLSNIIFSSAGRYDAQRTGIAGGRSPEYFIDNFNMTSIVAPTPRTGNQSLIKFDFDIYEPYSMGKLLESMQSAALANKFFSYLDNAPYLLKLDFQGYDENMAVYSTVSSRYFVLKFTKISFTVDEGGSRYKVEAVPFNHILYSDNYNITYTDLKLTGKDLKEACQNLRISLIKNELESVNEGRQKFADIYFIEFPKDGSDTSGAESEIATSSFNFDASYGGNFSFGSESKVDPATGKITRDNLTIDPTRREFQFSQTQSITNILTQLILASDYAKNAADPKNDKDGMVKWFKIDVQMELIPTFDDLIGDYPYTIKYRIVPYMVHRSVFNNFTAQIDYKPLERKIVKKYNYIYTGQNVDILRFNIEINNLFYVGVHPSSETRTEMAVNPGQQGTAPLSVNKTKVAQGGRSAAATSTSGRRKVYRDPDLMQRMNFGGAGTKDIPQKVAEAFHEAFIKGSSADLVNAELEILGDTYWIVDSGMANHFSPPQGGQGSQILEDGTANFVGADIYIYISYRTPIDVNTDTGLYDWPEAGRLGPFTGIYKVTEVDNIFAEGVFKQKIKCVRMVGQLSEYIYNQGVSPTAPAVSGAIEIKEPKQVSWLDSQ